jgi:hypothetical protein
MDDDYKRIIFVKHGESTENIVSKKGKNLNIQ